MQVHILGREELVNYFSRTALSIGLAFPAARLTLARVVQATACRCTFWAARSR